MTITAGRLKDKVSFFTNEATPNDSGGNSFIKVKYADTFAEVLEQSSEATTADGQQKINQALKVTIRYRSDIAFKKGNLMEWRGLSFVLDNFKVDPLRTSIEMILHTEIKNSER